MHTREPNRGPVPRSPDATNVPRPPPQNAAILALQRSAGNHATVLALQPATTEDIDSKWLAAVAFKNYREAARVLNGYSDDDILRKAHRLNAEQLQAIVDNADVNGGAADRIRIPLGAELLERRYRQALKDKSYREAARQLNGMAIEDITVRLEALGYDDPDGLLAIRDAALPDLGMVLMVASTVVPKNEPRRIEVWNRNYAKAINGQDFKQAAALLNFASQEDLEAKVGRLDATELEGIEYAGRGLNHKRVVDAAVKARGGAGAGDPATVRILGDLLRRAGLTESQIAGARSQVGSTGAQAMLSDLERLAPTLGAYGPRMVAIHLLGDIVSTGAAADVAALSAKVGKFSRIVLVRPDGYLVRATTGQPLQRIGKELQIIDGVMRFGPYEVGTFYVNDAGVLYRPNDALEPRPPSIGELGLQHNIVDKALDGVESAVKGMVEGAIKLLRNPIKTLEELRQLPSALWHLFETSPEYWERFKAMPLNDQVEQVTNIVTQLVGMYGGATAVMRIPGQAARLAGVAAQAGKVLDAADAAAAVVVQTLRVNPNGTLALATASVRAGVAAPALPGGPFGAVYMVSQANSALGEEGPTPDDIGKRLDEIEQQGGKGRRRPVGEQPPPVDFKQALKDAWKELRSEVSTKGMGPSQLGTRLHAAMARVLKSEKLPTGWRMAVEEPIGNAGGAGAQTVRQWLRGRGNPHGLLDELPKKVLEQEVRNLKPDLVMWEGRSHMFLWDLTSSSKAEHVAKTLLYGEILAKDNVLVQVMETYWSAGAK
jgi:hypothetical protein